MQVVLALACGALALVVVLPVFRPGEQAVSLSVGSSTCSASVCFGSSCTQTEWVEPDTLRVATIVNLPITREVDPGKATVAVKGSTLRLQYGTRGRHFLPGEPVPACVVPVPLRFEVRGLPRQSYSVSTVELPLLMERIFLIVAAALFLVPVVVFWRILKQRAGAAARPVPGS